MKKIVLLILLLILIIPTVTAICTVTLDKSTYLLNQSATATMSCSASEEKSKAYVVYWDNGSHTFETDVGTTPAIESTNFIETFVISQNMTWFNVTLTGTNLEGNDSASISDADVNDLIIKNFEVTSPESIFIGKTIGIEFDVVDENDKEISGASCQLAIEDSDDFPLFNQMTKSQVGATHNTIFLSNQVFSENTNYLAKLYCSCGENGTSNSCINEDGDVVVNSQGRGTGEFTILKWLDVNTVTNKAIYEMKEDIFICANVTNLNYSSRIPMHIYHQVRCSREKDNDDDLDRILIAHDDDMPDERGISNDTTQMQCKLFKIPEVDYLQGRNSECYASTTVWVLNENREKIMSYATTSSVFNISSDELNLEPDWQWIQKTRLNSVVNLSSSSYYNINGTGTGNIDLRIHADFENLDILHPFQIFNLIENITIRNQTNILEEHLDYELEFLEDDNVEIELRSVQLGDTLGWWNVTLDFYDLELRQTQAIESINQSQTNLTKSNQEQATNLGTIANKTGTFFLEIDCPSEGIIGKNIDCTLKAQVERNDVVEKEVDFTCFIQSGNDTYSSVNFNKMINQTLYERNVQMFVPKTFTDENQYLVNCSATYYNLGGIKDYFQDTFTAIDRDGTFGVETAQERLVKLVKKQIEEAKDLARKVPIGVWFGVLPVAFIGTTGTTYMLVKRKKRKLKENNSF